MNTIWSCIVTIIILYLIVVLLWLLLQKYVSPNKKLKGGGIKMKGGEGPVDDLRTAIHYLIIQQIFFMWQALLMQISEDQRASFTVTPEVQQALFMSMSPGQQALFNAMPEEQQALFMTPPDELPDLDKLKTANIIFSGWLSVVANGDTISNMNQITTATTLVEAALGSMNETIITPVLSACMKSPYAFYIANTIKDNPIIPDFYQSRLETDYLARLFCMSIDGLFGGELILRDIYYGGEAIKYIVRNINFIHGHVSDDDFGVMHTHYMSIIGYVIGEAENIATSFNTLDSIDNGNTLKNLVSCLMYIGMQLAIPDAVAAAFGIYGTVIPVFAWLCADEICDIEGFGIRDDMINEEIFAFLALNYPGMVDFGHIAEQPGVSPDQYMIIFTTQINVLAEFSSSGDHVRTYEIASSLVDPNIEMLQG